MSEVKGFGEGQTEDIEEEMQEEMQEGVEEEAWANRNQNN